MVWKQCDNQRQTNVSLEKEIQKLKNDLNRYMWGRMSPSKPQDAANFDDFSSDIKSKLGSLGSILVSREKNSWCI